MAGNDQTCQKQRHYKTEKYGSPDVFIHGLPQFITPCDSAFIGLNYVGFMAVKPDAPGLTGYMGGMVKAGIQAGGYRLLPDVPGHFRALGLDGCLSHVKSSGSWNWIDASGTPGKNESASRFSSFPMPCQGRCRKKTQTKKRLPLSR